MLGSVTPARKTAHASPATRAASEGEPQSTRAALLAAGAAVAARDGLAGMSVNRVVAEAGVAKGTFYVHFRDRAEFIDALHAGFHERVAKVVGAAVAGVPEGSGRVVAAAEAYLDACLADSAIKALALEARAEGSETSTMAQRRERAELALVPSLKAMGWPDARAAAHLLAAMTNEVAVRELDAGRRLPAARRALARFLGAQRA
jgi:TetR/AcrR family transcriptional repressor of nem operon